MFTLIAVTVGILMALAGALAVVYYAAPLSNHADLKAQATGIINQGQQVRSAAVLYYNQRGTSPSSVSDLVNTGYLTNMTNGWTVASVSGSPYLYAENTQLTSAECLEADKLLGYNYTSVPSCSSASAAETLCCTR